MGARRYFAPEEMYYSKIAIRVTVVVEVTLTLLESKTRKSLKP